MEVVSGPLLIISQFFVAYIGYQMRNCKNYMEKGSSEECKKILARNGLVPIHQIGKGAYGIVHLVSNGHDMAELYSVKCTCKKQFTRKPYLRKNLKREIDIMKTLDHKGLVQLHYTFEDEGWVFMVMEYCNQGNLHNLQMLKQQIVFPLNQFCSIFLDIIDALDYLHGQNIIHRDIKHQNILLESSENPSERMKTKLCDFGFSRQIDDHVSTFCGTGYFMAPEIFDKSYYDKSVDIWALGVVAYFMLFAKYPFKSVNMKHEIYRKCQNGFDLRKQNRKQNHQIHPQETKILTELFKGIFEVDPKKRSDIGTLRTIILSLQSQKIARISMETDISEQQEKSPEQEEVQFIKNVLEELKRENFLKPLQHSIVKYQLERVCISILSKQQKQTQQNWRQIEEVKERRKNMKQQMDVFSGKINELRISGLPKILTDFQLTDFQKYKQEYRLIIGHIFSLTDRRIQNYNTRIRIKLKLLCCHTINRVFSKEYAKDLFRHFLTWERKNGKHSGFGMRRLQDWMQVESCEKIDDTIKLIRNRFYGTVV